MLQRFFTSLPRPLRPAFLRTVSFRSVSFTACFLVALAIVSASPAAAENPVVKMTTNYGEITIELDAEKAPVTTENFVKYAEDGFYDGTIFHRVIQDFMIQGGGFDAALDKKSTRNAIKNEADNGLANERGTIAMARTGEPHSATAQFFINTVDNSASLNHMRKDPQGWGYCVFGKVTSGMEVVDAIAALDTEPKGGHRNVPLETALIEKVEVVPGGSSE